MERLKTCIQDKTGECGGCPVLSLIVRMRDLRPRSDEYLVVRSISGELCPPGNKVQVPLRMEPEIWLG